MNIKLLPILLILPLTGFGSQDEVIRTTQHNFPAIRAVRIIDTVVKRYNKLEAILDIDASYTNPYDYDQILVSATFISPSGIQKTVDGFYMQDFELNEFNGTLKNTGKGQFRVRFSPDEIGEWSFQIILQDLNGRATYEPLTFNCVIEQSKENNGFVRVGSTNYLEFDNGEQLILVGENMAWENTNPYRDYKNWITSLSDYGGNFIRLWHAHWGLGIEWKANWEGFSGLRQYKQSNCFYQDWLYDFCAEKGIYAMLALQHHGPVSTRVNANWEDSPYNARNGGPCKNTWDFFTNETAIAHTKNRFRYIIARWGYSKNILAWELFNEVNWMDDFMGHQKEAQDWHSDMADYLKSIDPYNHLVTTSFAYQNQDPMVWLDPNIDITQTHFYINTSNIERALAGGNRQYLQDFGKPTINGEFGLGGNLNLSVQMM